MRSVVIIGLLLIAAFVQGMNKIDAHAANKTRALISQQVEAQR